MSVRDNCPHGTFASNCKTCCPTDWNPFSGYILRRFPMLESESIIGYDPEQNKISETNAINCVDKMIDEMIPEPLDDSYWNFFIEENQKTAVVQLRKQFLSLSLEQKRQVLKDICMFCLKESRGPCYCERDD